MGWITAEQHWLFEDEVSVLWVADPCRPLQVRGVVAVNEAMGRARVVVTEPMVGACPCPDCGCKRQVVEQDGRALEVVVAGPFRLVPRELGERYPVVVLDLASHWVGVFERLAVPATAS